MVSVKVYPHASTKPRISKLSLCDVYAPKVWVTQCHFWPSKGSTSSERIYSNLKEGLSRTLSEVLELAGRIGRGSDDPRDLFIETKPNASVQFVYEDLSVAEDVQSYSALKSAGFPVEDIKHRLLPAVTMSPVVEGSPVFAAKLNKLNGGLAMTFGLNHLLADMSTVAEIERVWSMHTADVSYGQHSIHRPAIQDVHLRKRLSWALPGSAQFDDPHWKVSLAQECQLNLPAPAESAKADEILLVKAREDHLKSLHGDVEAIKWCVWYFAPERLTLLKRDASCPDRAKWISTIDALVGLLWSRIAYVKRESHECYQKSELLFPINVRQRLDPPLHPQLLGNAIDLISAECPLADLEANDAGLATAAQCIRQAVAGWEQSRFEAWLSLAASLPKDRGVCPHPLMLLAPQNMAFNDYSKSHSNILDWGHGLGCIERTRYMQPAASMAGCATGVVVYPKLKNGGLEVAITCSNAVRQALENDEVLQHYAQFSCSFG